MRDLISRSETGWAEGKRKTGNFIPITRVKRLQANKYNKTYTDLAARVAENNMKKAKTILKGGEFSGQREREKRVQEGQREEGTQGQEVTSNQQNEGKEVIE